MSKTITLKIRVSTHKFGGEEVHKKAVHDITSIATPTASFPVNSFRSVGVRPSSGFTVDGRTHEVSRGGPGPFVVSHTRVDG